MLRISNFHIMIYFFRLYISNKLDFLISCLALGIIGAYMVRKQEMALLTAFKGKTKKTLRPRTVFFQMLESLMVIMVVLCMYFWKLLLKSRILKNIQYITFLKVTFFILNMSLFHKKTSLRPVKIRKFPKNKKNMFETGNLVPFIKICFSYWCSISTGQREYGIYRLAVPLDDISHDRRLW